MFKLILDLYIFYTLTNSQKNMNILEYVLTNRLVWSVITGIMGKTAWIPLKKGGKNPFNRVKALQDVVIHSIL